MIVNTLARNVITVNQTAGTSSTMPTAAEKMRLMLTMRRLLTYEERSVVIMMIDMSIEIVKGTTTTCTKIEASKTLLLLFVLLLKPSKKDLLLSTKVMTISTPTTNHRDIIKTTQGQ